MWQPTLCIYILIGFWAAAVAAPGTIEGLVYMRPEITPQIHLQVQPEILFQGLAFGAGLAAWMGRPFNTFIKRGSNWCRKPKEQKYYFCSDHWVHQFDTNPNRYTNMNTDTNQQARLAHTASMNDYQTQVEELRVRISGMHCASCAATIEGAISQIPGVLTVDAAINHTLIKAVPGQVEYQGLKKGH